MFFFKSKIIVIAFLLVTFALLHFKSYNQYPAKTHAWAQSDHYAIALGFIDNGLDFFHPKTFSLTHQFPPKRELANPKGITSIDFPLIHFISAVVMKIIGVKAPWVFRLVALSWSLLVLYHLFRTVYRIKGKWMAYMIVSFIVFLPIYAFYQDSFLPSMAALNSLLLGSSFYMRHIYLNKKGVYYYAIFFIMLAALMRFTQVIFLIALTGVYLKNKKINFKILPLIFALSVVFIYFMYNRYLSMKYGSVFLNKPIIAPTFSDLFDHLYGQLIRYVKNLITLTHLAVIIVVFFLLKQQQKVVNGNRKWELWLIVSLIGVLSFNILMSWSMYAHDYYALDTWIPLIIFTFIYYVFKIEIQKNSIVLSLISILFIVSMTFTATQRQVSIYKSPLYRTEKIIYDFKKSRAFLNEQIPDDVNILLLCKMGWNTPLVGWQRDVYRIAWKFSEQIPEALKKDYDFIVTHNATYKETVINNFQNFEDYVIKRSDNGLVTVWKPKNKHTN